jgi:hypothetical protein
MTKTLLFCCLFSAALTATVFVQPRAASAEAQQFHLQNQYRTERPIGVTVQFEVGGDLKLASDRGVQTLPLSVRAEFDYALRSLPSQPAASQPHAAQQTAAVAHFRRAEARIQVAQAATTKKLSDHHPLIVIEDTADGLVLFSPHGPFTRDELDLIDLPCNPLALGRLLPDKAVAIGQRWKVDEAAMAALLRLSAVGRSDVEAALKEVVDGVAEVAFSGGVAGALEGVATEIEVKGACRVHLQRKLIEQVSLAVKENRGVGHVAAGVDVVARLKMHLRPVDAAELTDANLQGLPLASAGQAPPLAYRPGALPVEFLYDRRWHLTRDDPELAVLRLIDRGELVAQCNISPLARVSPERPTPLAEFQADIQRSLGASFGHFERAAETVTPEGKRILRVVAQGVVSELPIQWVYYLISDAQGQRAALVFTVEQKLIERFEGADQQIIDTLTLAGSRTAAAPTAADRSSQ